MQKIILKDYEGNDIHTYIYEQKGDLKGVIHIIHGAAEHFARYGVFAEFLNDAGYLVIGCDMLGHGLSTNTHEYVHFGDKNQDILAFESIVLVKEYIEENYPGQEVLLLGHSMGSFLARKMLIDYPDFYSKAIISSTCFFPQIVTVSGNFLAKLISFFKSPSYVSMFLENMGNSGNPIKARKKGIIGDNNAEWLSRDEETVNYYTNCDMCGQPFTAGSYIAVSNWVKFVNSKRNINLGNKETPILFITGSNDPLGDYGKGIQRLYETFKNLGYKNVEIEIYPEARHELLNEINRQEVYKRLLDFYQN
jgi:alpha-beta hydrolase superfamily lysophospholipase